MKILVMLFCADANQLLVSEQLRIEFQKTDIFCVVKDLTFYSLDNYASKELAYISGFYEDLKNEEYDAVVFLHSYPAKLFTRIKALKKININSFIVQCDFSLHFSYSKLGVDMYFVPHEVLTEDYVSHGIPMSKISVCGIPSPDLKFSNRTSDYNDVFCLVFADGYESCEVLDITQKSEDLCFDVSFAVLSYDSKQYRELSRCYDWNRNVNLFGAEDVECLKSLRKPDVIIINSSNVNMYSAMKCGVPIILLDDGSKLESEDFSFLTHIECCVPCKSADDVLEALKSRFFDAYFGVFLSNNCRKFVKENSVQRICENIISFNNKYDNNEKR